MADATGLHEPLLNEDGSSKECKDKDEPADKTCPASGKVGKRCAVEDFKLPLLGTFKSHPGGQEHLKTAAQSECPALLFLAYHMGCDLDGRIARAVKANGIEMPDYGELFADVHALVCKVKEEHKNQHWVFVAWCLIITAGFFVIMPWFLLRPGVAACIAVSLLFEVYFLNIFHTRHHKGGKLYDIPWLDRLTAPLYELVDNTWGYFPAAWWKNHHESHHMSTNSNCDPDLPAMYPLIRLFQAQKRHWFHVAQTFYFPLLLPFSVARFPVQNLFVHGGPWGYFVLWIVLMWIWPCAAHGWTGLYATLFAQGLTGVTLTSKFAVSHSHVDLVAHSTKAGDSLLTTKKTQMDAWMASQIEESMSWGGYWMTVMFGGINMQIEHHLAPAIDPPLLWCMADGLKGICKKHNIQYTQEPSIFHALFGLHRRLWVMGKS